MPPGAGASHFEAAIRKLEEETDYQRSSKGGVIDSRLHRGVKDAMDTQGYDWAETADSYMLAATFQIVRGFNRTIQIGYEPMSEMLRSGKRSFITCFQTLMKYLILFLTMKMMKVDESK